MFKNMTSYIFTKIIIKCDNKTKAFNIPKNKLKRTELLSKNRETFHHHPLSLVKMCCEKSNRGTKLLNAAIWNRDPI